METYRVIDSKFFASSLCGSIPLLQGNADLSRIGEYLSYFQIFPGKGAHYIIRQSFPVSQNPRHSWYQTFPAAPEVNFFLVSKCFVRPLTLHTLEGSCYIPPHTTSELRAPSNRLVGGLRGPCETSSRACISSAMMDGRSPPVSHLICDAVCWVLELLSLSLSPALPSAPFC